MIQAKWKQGIGFFNKADAQKVAEELYAMCDSLDSITSQEIVDRAKDESTELHKCFTWEDTKAANLWRLQEAGQIVRTLVIVEPELPKERPEIRVFYKSGSSPGYKPTEIIIKQEDEYKALLTRAWSELRAFKAKYSMLKELQDIFILID